jgi:hypothetical protein
MSSASVNSTANDGSIERKIAATAMFTSRQSWPQLGTSGNTKPDPHQNRLKFQCIYVPNRLETGPIGLISQPGSSSYAFYFALVRATLRKFAGTPVI